MQQLKIEYMSLNDIKPYKRNAKKHPKWQIEQIVNSIQNFGMNDPVAISGADNEIVEGHGRYLACKELDYDPIPVIRLDHLTDEQRKAYNLIHNKLCMNSDFDLKTLNEELDDIFNIDMSEFGFEIFNMDDIQEVDGYDENNDDREYFSKTLTFPIEKKKAVTCYLKKHYDEVIERIISESESEANSDD